MIRDLSTRAKVIIVAVTALVSILIMWRIISGRGEEPAPVTGGGSSVVQPVPGFGDPSATPSPTVSKAPAVDAVGGGETSDDRSQRNREDAAMDILTAYRESRNPDEVAKMVSKYQKKLSPDFRLQMLRDASDQVIFTEDGLVKREVTVTGLQRMSGGDIMINLSVDDTFRDGLVTTARETWTLEFQSPDSFIVTGME